MTIAPPAPAGERVWCPMFIAGEWTAAASGERSEATSPADGGTDAGKDTGTVADAGPG